MNSDLVMRFRDVWSEFDRNVRFITL